MSWQLRSEGVGTTSLTIEILIQQENKHHHKSKCNS